MRSESHFVAPDHPNEQGHGKGVETHESRVDSPFRLNEPCTTRERPSLSSIVATLTSIDDDKTWDRLETDQTGRCKLPGIVAFVQPVRIGLRGDVERHDEKTDRFFARPTK